VLEFQVCVIMPGFSFSFYWPFVFE
jgi:hypothetical protein